MKSLLSFFAILFLFFIGVSCSNNDDSTPMPITVITTFTASLTPVGGNGSMASGDAKLKLNETAKTFDITVTFTGLTPTAGHIHGADGEIVIPFPDESVSMSPIHYSGSITDAEIVELMANNYYVNLHTVAFPSGEISGKLIKGSTSTGGGGGGGGY